MEMEYRRKRVVRRAGFLRRTFLDWSDERMNDSRILGLAIGAVLGILLHAAGVW
jgi:hypothetical protein